MKAITILAAAVIGTFLGTGIGIAQASTEPSPTTSPVPVHAAHDVVHEANVLVMEEVHITAAKSPRAVTRGHARPRTVCSVETLTQGSGTVRFCRPE